MVNSTLKESLEKADKVILRDDVSGRVGCLRIEEGNVLIVRSGEERIEFTETDDARALNEERTRSSNEGTKCDRNVGVDARAFGGWAIGLRRLRRIRIR